MKQISNLSGNQRNLAFGAVFIPTNKANRDLKRMLITKSKEGSGVRDSYHNILYKSAGVFDDPNKQNTRGEFLTGVKDRGEVIISSFVDDIGKLWNLAKAGFKGVRIIHDSQLGGNLQDLEKF